MTTENEPGLASLFDAAVLDGPGRDFLHVPATATRDYAPGPVTFTYAEAAVRVAALRDAYRAAGIDGAFRVGLALDNRAEFFLHLLALNGLGASVVPLNAAMTLEELGFVGSQSDMALAICHEGHAAHLRAALPPHVRIAVDPFGGLPTLARGPAALRGEAALVYTSGTTGTPKGCILDERYFRQAGAHYVAIGGYCAFRPGEDRLITPLPVTHMNALVVSFVTMIMTRGCLVQLDRFHPTTWWESVRASRATCFHYLGVMPAMLLAAPPSPADDLGGRVRFGFGAGVDPRHHAAFERRFGVPLIEAWAMTETGGGAWITASHEPRHVGSRCFGRVPDGLLVRVVDEAGSDVPPGAAGELLVRRAGPAARAGFFAGYYKDAVATEAAWTGGWFHTGDSVRSGDDGSLHFVDRLKNIVRRSGENIAAVEVESVLQQVPGVAACAVTAVPDEIRGEDVFAFLVPVAGVEAGPALAERAQAACLAALVYYKAPAYVCYVAQLPQTASQKLARGEIKRLAARAVADGEAIDLRVRKRRPGREGPGAPP
jgi:acyl-CoA synthetase (AMP-forming)/AMP-acid ligase II